MNTYCGLDLGVKSSAFCIVDEKGKLIAEAEIPTDEKCFERAFGRADMMRVVVEACPLAEWACQLLEELGHEAIIIDARHAKAVIRTKKKTDQVDARVILSFAQSQRLPIWSPESKSPRQLYQLVVQADAIRADLRQWANRRHAQEYTPDVPEAVKKAQRAIVRSLTQQLTKVEEAITLLCRTDKELKEPASGGLVTITGIAHLSAVKVLAYGGNALTERNRKELTAHAGLASCHHQSGTSARGKSRLAKQGDRRLRSAPYMPTLVGIVHNPVLKQFYEHLLQMGKPKMVALVACMRKLLLIIRSMLINKKPFNPELLPLT